MNLFQRSKQETYLRELSVSLDLIAMGMEAGLDFNLALNRVVQYGPQGALKDQFQEVLREISLGEKRIRALRNMHERIRFKPLKGLINAIHLSETLGGNLASILHTHSRCLRLERLHKAEERAQKIPVKLVFPLIFFIFPCVFIVLFAPILYRLSLMDLW